MLLLTTRSTSRDFSASNCGERIETNSPSFVLRRKSWRRRSITPEEQEMEVAHSGESAACEVLRTEVLREDDLRLRPVLMNVPRFHDDSGSLRDEEHLDCLSSMFSFDGDYLQYLFVAVLQSELPPDEIPPTVHNLSHVALSIVLHGCAATYNAYNQESKYRIPKRLCGRNGSQPQLHRFDWWCITSSPYSP